MNEKQFQHIPWEVTEWRINGVLTGYRVMRFFDDRDYEIARGFGGNIYEPDSFDRAHQEATRLCNELNQPVLIPKGGAAWCN